MRYLLTLAMVFGLAMPAVASLKINPDGDLNVAIPNNNNFKGGLNALGLDTIVDGDVEAVSNGVWTFRAIAAESGFANKFTVPGVGTYDEALDPPPGNPTFGILSPGILIGSTAVSTGDTLSSLGAFFSSILGSYFPNDTEFGIFTKAADLDGPFTTVYLGLDDNGAGPDDNHDDLLISITYSVPEATSLLVWGAMLVPVGFVARRKFRR